MKAILGGAKPEYQKHVQKGFFNERPKMWSKKSSIVPSTLSPVTFNNSYIFPLEASFKHLYVHDLGLRDKSQRVFLIQFQLLVKSSNGIFHEVGPRLYTDYNFAVCAHRGKSKTEIKKKTKYFNQQVTQDNPLISSNSLLSASYLSNPAIIRRINPNRGSENGNDRVIIYGDNFIGTPTNCYLDAFFSLKKDPDVLRRSPAEVITTKTLILDTPPSPPGLADVTVQNCSGFLEFLFMAGNTDEKKAKIYDLKYGSYFNCNYLISY